MEFSIEKKVGIFFLLTIITLGVMIELVEDWDPFQRQYDYHAYFSTVVGLRAGDPVRLAGVDVGKIRQIEIDNSRVRIDFYVTSGVPIKTDTVAMVRQANLLGGSFLGLGFGSEQAPVLPPDSIVPTREGASLEELIDSFNRNQNRFFSQLETVVADSREPFLAILNRLDAIAKKIDDGEGTLGLLVNDPAVYRELQGALAQIREVVARINQGEGTMGRLVNDPTLYDEVSRVVVNLREITARINHGEGTLGRLVVEDEVYRNLNQTLADLQDIVARTNRGEGTLGRLVSDETLYNEATGAVTRINSIVGKVDSGTGTIGRLVNDDGLYREAETALQKIEKTVDGMNDSGPLSALGVVVGTLF